MKPLEDIRVLDVTRIVSGPVCCWLLASLGAEVIRIDAPGGDPTWRTQPLVGPRGAHRGDWGPEDIGISALRRGRGKRSTVLDLKSEAGLEIFRELVVRSDVLVENFVPGTTRKLGIDYERMKALNPKLVYCSITGYGDEGPYRDRPSMDLVVQAMSGLMAKTGFPDGPPTKVGATVGDQVPALFGALGILAALQQRERDGLGQHVDIAMLDSLVTLLWDEPLDDYEERGIPERIGNGDPRGAPLGVFETLDGQMAMVMTSEAQWQSLLGLMERPDLLERFPDSRSRFENRDAVNEFVASWCLEQKTDALVERCLAIGIPVGPVQSAWSARRDPHLAQRGTLEHLRHRDANAPSTYLAPVLPVRLSRNDTRLSPAEPLGSSTEAVLREVLDCDDARIEALRAEGAFGKA